MGRTVKLVAFAFAVWGVCLVFPPGCSYDSTSDSLQPSEQPNESVAETTVPEIAPYLDSVPSAVDGQGTAVVTPADALPIGTGADFEITLTTGEAGISDGGYALLQISPWWGWSQPQAVRPGAPGYTQVTTGSGIPYTMHILPLNRVLVSPKKEGFASGEKIIFRYSGRVDRFAEAEELFQIFVDADGDGHSACIATPPTLRILADSPSRLNVTAPSQVQPGQEIEVRASPLDRFGNWGVLPHGTYTLTATRDGISAGEQKTKVSGAENTLSFTYTMAEEGIYFFKIKGPSPLEGKSNVTLCQEGLPHLNLYFGDIHGHSRISDGTGTPEDYYSYAREVSGLDIAALTDHADHGTIPVKGEVWERIKKAANDANDPGRFVTFLGFEWTNWIYGHRNVYYRDGDGPVFRSVDPESDTPQEVWQIIEPLEAMTIAHHVGGGPVATDWTIEPPPSKEWLVEICSIHGSSEYYGGEAMIYSPRQGAFVRDALARGYRLGIIGGGDTHDGHPGQRSAGARVGGVVGVYSPELTREAVWEALRRRQVYGTSGPKIILNFRVADSPMGSEVHWDGKGSLPIALRAVGCDDIATVEIIRNGEPLFAAEGEGVFVQFLAEDPEPLKGVSWYYARVIQKDGQMAWSSPVWVTRE